MKSAPQNCRQARRSRPVQLATAFTLIELLVVISIIALLIGILLPALGAARHTARVTTDLTQIRSIAQSSAVYSVDNDSYFPMSYSDAGRVRGAAIDELLINYLVGVSYTQQDAINNQYVLDGDIDLDMWQSPLDTLDPLFTFPGAPQKRSYTISGSAPLDVLDGGSFQARTSRGVMHHAVWDEAAGSPAAGDDGYSLREDAVRQSSATISYAPYFHQTSYLGWPARGNDMNPFEMFGTGRSYVGTNGFAANPHVHYGYDGPSSAVGNDPLDTAANYAFADGHSAAVLGRDTLDPSVADPRFDATGESLWNAHK